MHLDVILRSECHLVVAGQARRAVRASNHFHLRRSRARRGHARVVVALDDDVARLRVELQRVAGGDAVAHCKDVGGVENLHVISGNDFNCLGGRYGCVVLYDDAAVPDALILSGINNQVAVGLHAAIGIERAGSNRGSVLNGHITAIGLDIDVALGEDLRGILDEHISRAARNHRNGGFSRENRSVC